MSVTELVQKAQALLDAGVLTKHDESFVSTTLSKFDKGSRLDSSEVSRLRDLVNENL